VQKPAQTSRAQRPSPRNARRARGGASEGTSSAMGGSTAWTAQMNRTPRVQTTTARSAWAARAAPAESAAWTTLHCVTASLEMVSHVRTLAVFTLAVFTLGSFKLQTAPHVGFARRSFTQRFQSGTFRHLSCKHFLGFLLNPFELRRHLL
jgi:hypothetical protein